MNWLQPYSAVLRISGPDANSFLQGQFTNDVRGQNLRATYGLWLDHKGKVRADSTLLRLADGEWLAASYFCPGADLKAHLERFIIADDVTLADETDQWMGLGAWGIAADQLRKELKVVPGGGELAPSGDGWAFVGRRSRASNLEMIVPRASARLRGWPAQANKEDCERERIGGVIPAVPFDIGPEDLPNEGGLEAEGVSFTKGCFTGQEVMARLKNLGQVRRRLHLVRGPGKIPAARTALFQGDRKVGDLRTAVAEGDGFIALAMLSLLHLDATRGLALAPDAQPNIAVRPHG